MSSPKNALLPRSLSPSKSQGIGTLIHEAALAKKELDAAILMKLREFCLALSEAVETVKWGHPTFEAGKKVFAVLDHYHGRPCIAFRTSMEKQKKLCRDQRCFPAPYAATRGWVCLCADGQMNWSEVRDILLVSYRLAALKRMLSLLEASGATSSGRSRTGLAKVATASEPGRSGGDGPAPRRTVWVRKLRGAREKRARLS
jgi:predicted DNA-binding protein (MmcQ/YjbR family)